MPYTRCFPVVIEDDPTYAALVKVALERAGVLARNITTIASSAEALGYFGRASSQTNPPSFVILDCHLRGGSGLDVLQQMKTKVGASEFLVFVLTSSEDPKELTRAFDLGVRSFFMKPPDFEDLTDIIQAMLAHWVNRRRRYSKPGQTG